MSHDKTKNLQKHHGVHFLLAIYCWASGLPLRVVCIPSEILLEKTNFSFASGYWVGIAAWSGTGLDFSCERWFHLA